MMEVHEEDDPGKDYDRRLMRRFLAYVRPYSGLVVLSFFLLAARIAGSR